ncbi:MAG TPA: SDR family NAD(P)-dependent oxidoreductase [Acidimicrobiales bacterium]|nr:SDR family NAD(P)-dependent oxidoreductase [Acidimicrobiales bacterium]
MSAADRVVDELLEATVVGSFSRIGYDVRSRLGHWEPPLPMAGRHVVVTGATSGLGFECAASLGAAGASVTFLARDGARAEQARSALVARAGHDDVDFEVTDISELSAIRRTAQVLHEQGRPIDVLVHNAGALTRHYETTSEGVERTVAAHVLGPCLLTGLLLPLLRQGGPEAGVPARVITVSSGGMYSQRFALDLLEMGEADYDGVVAYARAKRAQLVLNHEWARRIDPSTVVFHAMHPGWANTPGVASSLPGFHRVMGRLLRSPAQGADTMVWLASATEVLQAPSGSFWLDHRRRWEHKLPWTRPADARLDQERLWGWCTDRTGGDPAAPAS